MPPENEKTNKEEEALEEAQEVEQDEEDDDYRTLKVVMEVSVPRDLKLRDARDIFQSAIYVLDDVQEVIDCEVHESD